MITVCLRLVIRHPVEDTRVDIPMLSLLLRLRWMTFWPVRPRPVPGLAGRTGAPGRMLN